MKLTTAFIAATVAISFGATVAHADYNGGDPVKKGKMCWSATDGLGHGMWGKCPKPTKMAKAPKNKKMHKTM